MKVINKKVIAYVLCLVVLAQTGCWDQKIYERIGFILQVGLELDENGELQYTVVIPVVEPEAQEDVEIITTTGNLLRESREKVRLSAGKSVEGGKTQHIYFSKELARKGIGEYLDVFLRSTENPLLANIIVVDGSPKELMEQSVKFKDKPRPTFYVNDLLVSARKNSYTPETRISDFTIMQYCKTIDPVTPMVHYTPKKIEIVGAALFSGDKMVGDISTGDMGLLSAIMGKKGNINYVYREQKKEADTESTKAGAAISIKGIKRKVKISIKEDKPVIDINLKFRASIDEYSRQDSFNDPDAKKMLEDTISQAMEKDIERVLKYLQEVGSDPAGFGEMVRVKYNKYWKTNDWKEVYPEATFNVEVKMNFEFYGAIN